MKHFFLIILAMIVLACGGIEDMPYLSESVARREAWQKLLDTPSYVEAMCREFAASDLSQLVAEECEPLHTYDAPFCSNPECACHTNEALFQEYIERPVKSGALKIWEAQALLWPERLEGEFEIMAEFTVGQRVEVTERLLAGEKATIIKIDEQNWPGYVCIRFDRRDAFVPIRNGSGAILSDRWIEQDHIKSL